MINSYVLHCFSIERIVHISATRCPTEMGFGSNCSILNGQVIFIEKSKLNFADMWLIPLDRVTFLELQLTQIAHKTLQWRICVFQFHLTSWILVNMTYCTANWYCINNNYIKLQTRIIISIQIRKFDICNFPCFEPIPWDSFSHQANTT